MNRMIVAINCAAKMIGCGKTKLTTSLALTPSIEPLQLVKKGNAIANDAINNKNGNAFFKVFFI